MQKYNKAFMALIGLALTVLNIIGPNDPTIQFIISAATLLGVHLVPNLETGVRDVETEMSEVQRG